MNILCLNTCLKQSYVCLITDNGSYESVSDGSVQHSITLLSQIDEILNNAKINVSSLDYIGVCIGPGSFTGIRIGLAVAKGLANALKIKIIPIDTLTLIAYNTLNNCQYAVMKGIKDEYFLGTICNGKIISYQLLQKSELDNIINFENYICSCDNLNEFNCQLETIEKLNMKNVILENIALAKEPINVEPMYLRLSQAEVQKKGKK